MKYKVGDKVRIVSKWGPGCRQNPEGWMDKWLGKVMTVRAVRFGTYRMEEDKGEHGGDGWAWFPEAIAGPAESAQKIVVTTDGKTTTARLYDGKSPVRSATAECSSRDTFVFETGAALAVDRLLGREKKPEPETVFSKEKLVPGVFGHTSDGDWFVVVGTNLVYTGGDHDTLSDVSDDGALGPYRIDCLVRAVCFKQAKIRARTGAVLWLRPGTKF